MPSTCSRRFAALNISISCRVGWGPSPHSVVPRRPRSKPCGDSSAPTSFALSQQPLSSRRVDGLIMATSRWVGRVLSPHSAIPRRPPSEPCGGTSEPTSGTVSTQRAIGSLLSEHSTFQSSESSTPRGSMLSPHSSLHCRLWKHSSTQGVDKLRRVDAEAAENKAAGNTAR